VFACISCHRHVWHVWLLHTIWHVMTVKISQLLQWIFPCHITNDISMGLRTPAEEAEKIKIKYGCALVSLVRKDETIEVPSVGGRKPRVLSRQTLAEIVEPRVEEIFTLVHNEVVRTGFANLLASGIVLTGGSAILEGAPELAEQIFNLLLGRGRAFH